MRKTSKNIKIGEPLVYVLFACFLSSLAARRGKAFFQVCMGGRKITLVQLYKENV